MTIPGTLSLKTLNMMISVEANAEGPNVLSRIPRFLEQLLSKVTRDITATKGETPSEQLNQKAFTKLLENSNYAALAQIDIFRPTGMKGNYFSYIAMLADFQEELGDIEKRLLTPLKRTVAQMLAEPTRLKQAFPTNYKLADIKKLQVRFAGVVDTNDGGDKILYGRAVARNKDWESIISTINLVDEQYLREPNSELLKSVGELTEHVGMLIERIKDQPDVYEAKGRTVGDLVDALYLTAREIELYAAHGFNLATGKKAIVDSYNKMKDAIA